MQADPAVIHGSDYPAASRLVNANLDASLPLETLEEMLAEMEKESPKALAPKTFVLGILFYYL